MYIAFNREKGSSAIVNYCNFLLRKLRLGFVMSITGSPFLKMGTGKSFTALKIAELLDKEYLENPENAVQHKVAFYPREFLEALDYVESQTAQKSGKPRIGQVVIMDEAGITAPSSLWFSFSNRAIHYALSTFRYLKAVVIVVTPSISFIDRKIRQLIALHGYTEKALGEDGYITHVYLSIYRVLTDFYGEKIIYQKLTMYDRATKRFAIIDKIKVSLPNEALIEAYEKKMLRFKRNLRKELIKSIEQFEKYQQSTEEKKDLKELANKILDNPKLRERLFIGGKVYPENVRYELEKEGINLTFAEARMLCRIIKAMWSGEEDD